MGAPGGVCQCGGSLYYRDALAPPYSRTARLQGMGHWSDAAGGAMGAAGGYRRRGFVPLQSSVGYGCRPRADGGRRLDDSLVWYFQRQSSCELISTPTLFQINSYKTRDTVAR